MKQPDSAMKQPDIKLDQTVLTYLEENNASRNIECLRTFLNSYLSNLRRDHNIPDRKKFGNWYDRVIELEMNDETWHIAQNIWDAQWILEEVENIESSIKQIEACLHYRREP